jgi:hypothetical protein
LLATVTVGAAGVTGLLVDTALLAPISTTNTAGTVPAGARVRGRIVGAARRSGPVTVTLTAGAPATPLAAPIFWDGTFEFPAVPNGTYAASVQPSIPGAKPTTVTVANSRPVADLEIRVPASREVSGIVTINGPGTLPAKAGFLLAAADGSSTNRVSAPIQPDGTFTLTIPEGVTVRYATDLLPSGYSVDSITFAGRDTENQPITLTATNSAELSVRLNAARATTVRVNGRVIGAPLVEGRIWLTSAARSIASIETAVQTGGAFSFANVLPGDYILRIVAAGIPASLPAGTIRVADKNIDGLELAGPLFVTGRVVVAGGGNASRFSLPLQSAAGEATITIDPQQDGSFRVALPAGAWQTGAPVGLPTGMKISSMTYGAIDISQAPLRVTATDTAVLTISLSR